MFALNQWYVVASRSELTNELLARTVCDIPLVLYRKVDGDPVVLNDRCSHRSYPLSLGSLFEDQVQCGYHGLRFDCAGTCVWVPGQDRIPSKANIVARPVAEVGPWVWVWLGDPESPDETKLPSIPWFDDPAWTTVDGMEPLAARHELLVDNLMDLSHETFLHAGFIGTPEVAESPITTTVDAEVGVVRVSRRMKSVECPPFYTESSGLQTPIDRWQDIEYFPTCFYLLNVRIAPAGSEPHADGSDPDAIHMKVLYGITPVDASNTLDFWGLCRDFALDDQEVSDFLTRMNTEVVLQDVVALSILEQRLVQNPGQPEVSFKIDAGGLAARRMMEA